MLTQFLVTVRRYKINDQNRDNVHFIRITSNMISIKLAAILHEYKYGKNRKHFSLMQPANTSLYFTKKKNHNFQNDFTYSCLYLHSPVHDTKG